MEPNDKLDAAVQAMLDQPVPQGPPATLDAELLVTVRQLDRQPQPSPHRRWLARPLARLALAAAVLLAILTPALWLLLGGGAEVTFAQVLDKIRSVHTVTMKAKTELSGMDVDLLLMYQDETKMRVESRVKGQLVGVTIVDRKAGRMAIQYPVQKLASVMAYQPPARATASTQPSNAGSLWDELRKLHPDDAQKLGIRRINNRAAEGFKIARGDSELSVWVDPSSRLPVELDWEYVADGRKSSTIVMTDFEFDRPLDEGLFDMSTPRDYTEVALCADAAKGPPLEAQLVDLFRIYSRLSGGAFPADMQWPTIFKGVMPKEQPATAPANPMDMLDTEGKRVIVLMGSTTSMLYGMGKDGWGYVGAGVKLGDATRPVLWYHRPGGAAYRVLLGDLHLEDAAEKPAGAETPAIDGPKDAKP